MAVLCVINIHNIIGMEKEVAQKLSEKKIEINDRKELEKAALTYVLRSLDKPLTDITKVANE